MGHAISSAESFLYDLISLGVIHNNRILRWFFLLLFHSFVFVTIVRSDGRLCLTGYSCFKLFTGDLNTIRVNNNLRSGISLQQCVIQAEAYCEQIFRSNTTKPVNGYVCFLIERKYRFLVRHILINSPSRGISASRVSGMTTATAISTPRVIVTVSLTC